MPGRLRRGRLLRRLHPLGDCLRGGARQTGPVRPPCRGCAVGGERGGGRVITIPTGDLVGILADVVNLACTEDELPAINTVRLEWDGGMLHALATDTLRIGISSWHPDDEPEGEAQDDLFTSYGGADDPWAILLPLDDAKHLIKVFKLPLKEQRSPLTVDLNGDALTVKRARETGYPEQTVRVPGRQEPYPDLRKHLAEHAVVKPVAGLAFNARLLADFAKVRPRGPMELSFTGAAGLAHVLVGKRFVGAVMPVRVGDEVAA